jgi:plastocyanin
MSNETLFFICGIALAVSAVVTSLIGLKVKDFPGKAFPLVVLWFAILIGGAATFSVLHAKDEDDAKAAEFEKAGEKFEKEGIDDAAGEVPIPGEGQSEGGEEGGSESKGGGQVGSGSKGKTSSGPGGTVQLAADATDLAFDTTTLSSKPGKVTIDLTNPSALEHDVAIEQNGKQLADSELIANGAKTTATAELAPGTYTFFCTVPGHREAGMEGTLTVK